ncbi:MAG: polysulfide reductase [Clostridia bacterium]|nr:polysulfide reductase [Clostridia bacterium]
MSASVTNVTHPQASTFEQVREDLIMPLHKNTFANKMWIRFLIVIIILGTIAYVHQLITGLGVTAMRDYTAWGVYIANFVFWVAVSLIGSLISSILKLLHQNWSNPLSRIAELIALGAITMAAASIVIDMGRPDRLQNILIHGRIQSPIVWDFFVVNTYLVISIILLYLPLIPDIAILRDRMTDAPRWQRKMYHLLSLGWHGTKEQWRLLKRAMLIMILLILPVAFSIHTVTSWLFAVNSRAGWHSTIFGPYFVAGAFVAGSAAVIIAMYVFQRRHKLQQYITDRHFNMMNKLLVLTMLLYLYFNINEYLVPGYTWQRLDGAHLEELLLGHEAVLFWLTQILGLILPIILLLFRRMRKPLPSLIIAIFVLMGAWMKRMIIVIPTQLHPEFPIQNVPKHFLEYIPTYTEYIISAATLAGAMLIITLLVRVFPVVPIWEEAHDRGIHKIFKAEKTSNIHENEA